ncbi:MAG: DUF4288 domain-containing protein [Bryobacteraceae bacterium]|jgi:hypothetical protein
MKKMSDPQQVTKILPGREWYLATLVMEILVEGDPRNVVHRNLFLISGCSPGEAYCKAVLLGQRGEMAYDNPAGLQVRHRFRGIADLDTLIDGEVADGAELAFEQTVGLPEDQIRGWVRTKEDLCKLHRPSAPESYVPDYSSNDVVVQAAEIMARRDPGADQN